MKVETARIGIISAIYVTTALSLLYTLPHWFLISIITTNNNIPSLKAMPNATLTAKLAPSAFPAPTSFDTLVL